MPVVEYVFSKNWKISMKCVQGPLRLTLIWTWVKTPLIVHLYQSKGKPYSINAKYICGSIILITALALILITILSSFCWISTITWPLPLQIAILLTEFGEVFLAFVCLKVFVLPLFFKYIFMRYWILGWQIFFQHFKGFAAWSLCLHCLWQ